jgi:hypothetical protein
MEQWPQQNWLSEGTNVSAVKFQKHKISTMELVTLTKLCLCQNYVSIQGNSSSEHVVLTAVNIKIVIFWDVTPVVRYIYIEVTFYLHKPDGRELETR